MVGNDENVEANGGDNRVKGPEAEAGREGTETETVTAAAVKEAKSGADVAQQQKQQQAMALNVAYEALEQVRRANVAIEYGEEANGHGDCIPCLREERLGRAPPRGRLMKVVARVRRTECCLTCGNPTCPHHRFPDLARQGIAVCSDCSRFLECGGVATAAAGDDPPEDRRMLMNSMLDVYDRSLLALRYSSQFVDEVAASLERNTRRNDRIGLGTSATGVLSGVVGVAAAATIFTPVGPPLLIASILFGGGATAASAGSEAVNYNCSANKMADTIITLRLMVSSIARVTAAAAAAASEKDVEKSADGSLDRDYASSSTRNWTRATANALKPLTAGALSAASVVMEAREMKNAVEKIRAGSPCSKAESLRALRSELERLPATSVVARDARKLFCL